MNMTTDARTFQHLAPELRLYGGADSLAALKRELKRSGANRAAVVSGRSVANSYAMELLRQELGATIVAECHSVRSNSPVAAVRDTADVLARSEANAVIAVGGGSAAVTARAASILLAEGKPAHELCTRRLESGAFESPRLDAPKLPQFVIPTTPSNAFMKAGSAVHDDDGNRLALFDPKTRAKAIFIHPEFLATAPTELVQSATLNTMSTAIEALESPRCDVISEAMLRQCLRLISAYVGAASDSQGLAREQLALAGVLCGRGTEGAGGGLSSVLAHAIGHRSHVANGLVNAIVLPHTLRFNAPATGRAGERIADSLVISGPREPDPIAALETVLGKLPIARRLRDIGVPRDELAAIAQAAMQDWFIGRNARPVRGVEDVISILEAAW